MGGLSKYFELDLDQLIRVRRIRNHLAHEEGAFDEAAYTQNDIDWLRFLL